jgi:hypothetical protein
VAVQKRDAFLARVRRVLGSRKRAQQVAIFEDENLAVVEFERETVIVVLRRGRFHQIRLTNGQGAILARLLREMFSE